MKNTKQSWKKILTRNGIDIHVKGESNQARLKTFRGTTVYKPSCVFSIVPILFDLENGANWLQYVSSVKEIGRHSDTNRTLRVETLAPWPAKNRVAIVRTSFQQDPETLQIKLRMVNDETYIDPPGQRFIRVPVMEGSFTIDHIDNNQIKVTYEVVLDPGGQVPLKLVNLVLKDAPYFTLHRLRSLIEKPKYQNVRLPFVTYPSDAIFSS